MNRKNRTTGYYTEDWEVDNGTVLERNGNLTLVEKSDGSVDWFCPCELCESTDE